MDIKMGQDSPWKSQSEWQRTEINRDITFMVWPNLGLRMAEEQNKTEQLPPVKHIDINMLPLQKDSPVLN